MMKKSHKGKDGGYCVGCFGCLHPCGRKQSNQKSLDTGLKLRYTVCTSHAPVAQWIEQRPSKP